MTNIAWVPVRTLRQHDVILHEGRHCPIHHLVHVDTAEGERIVVKAGIFTLGLEPDGTMPVVERAVAREPVSA